MPPTSRRRTRRRRSLAAHADGLIALTGGPDGPIDRALRDSQSALAEARLDRLKAMFGDRLYVEMQRHGLKSEHDVEPQLLKLAYAKHIPIVATNEAYFATPDDYEAHDALLCIAGGRYVVEDDRRRVTREHDFKSAEAMAEVFADLPEALDNTIEIAKRCAFRPQGRKPILPRFVAVADEVSETELSRLEAEELRRQAEQGLADAPRRRAAAPRASRAADYEKRLAYELDVIARMKFPGYFLIVADFIKWAKAQGIPVGPGRGSGAGSVVAWALTITDLDPLRFGLLFERFLNPERVSMPDFDIDFCQDRRDEVIRYVQRKYGHDRVAQIITHGKLQARAVLRDVGRVLQMPYGQVDRLCKLVPNNPGQPGHAAGGHRRRAEAAGADRRRSDGGAPRRDRAEAGRPLPPRLDARRRHGHRRPAAGRAGAADARSEIEFARHPVQLEAGRSRGPREVRLPRPQDAHRAAEGGGAGQARARHRRRSARRCRSTIPRPSRSSPRRTRSACSSWNRRACARA